MYQKPMTIVTAICYVFAVRDFLLQYFNHDFAKMQDKLHQVMDNETKLNFNASKCCITHETILRKK